MHPLEVILQNSEKSNSPEIPVTSSENLNTDEVSGDPQPSQAYNDFPDPSFERLPTNRAIYGSDLSEDEVTPDSSRETESNGEGDDEHEEEQVENSPVDFGGKMVIFRGKVDDSESDVVEVTREEVPYRSRRYYFRECRGNLGDASTSVLHESVSGEDESSDYLKDSTSSSTDTDMEDERLVKQRLPGSKKLSALVFSDEDGYIIPPCAITGEIDVSLSEGESTEESSSSSDSGSSEISRPLKRRRVKKKSSKKAPTVGPNGRPILGGPPPSGLEEDDEVETEHEGSEDESFDLYLASDEDEDPPKHFLALWESPLMKKDEGVKRLTGGGSKRMHLLRRKKANTTFNVNASATEVEDVAQPTSEVTIAAQPRQPIEKAYRHYMWIRRQYGCATVEGIEMYEKLNLLKDPSHPGGIRISVGFLHAGMTLPLSRLTVSLLNYFHKAPCQFTSTAYAMIAIVEDIGKMYGREISVEEFLTMFTLQLASKGQDMRHHMASGQAVYSFNRRPRIGFFAPPSKLPYKQAKVLEIYGNYEPMYKGFPLRLKCRTCNDYADIKELNELNLARRPVVVSRIGDLTLAQRRAALPRWKKWFPRWLKAAEDCYKRGVPYLPPKEQRKKDLREAAEAKKRADLGLPPVVKKMSKLQSRYTRKRAAESTADEATKKTARLNIESSPRLLPNISALEKNLDATLLAQGTPALVVSLPDVVDSSQSDQPEKHASKTTVAAGKTQKGSNKQGKATEVRTRYDYRAIETMATKKNRKLSAALKDDMGSRFNPSCVDGEGHYVHKNASGKKDPLVAGMLANFVLEEDMQDCRQIIEVGGEGALLQDGYKDCMSLTTTLTALLESCQRKDAKIRDLYEQVKKANPGKVKSLEQQLTMHKTASDSLKAECERQKGVIDELTTRVADCDEHVKRHSITENELKESKDREAVLQTNLDTCQADLADFKKRLAEKEAELEEKMAAALAISKDNQETVNRYDLIIEQHMKKCPELDAEAEAMMQLTDAEFAAIKEAWEASQAKDIVPEPSETQVSETPATNTETPAPVEQPPQ